MLSRHTARGLWMAPIHSEATLAPALRPEEAIDSLPPPPMMSRAWKDATKGGGGVEPG